MTNTHILWRVRIRNVFPTHSTPLPPTSQSSFYSLTTPTSQPLNVCLSTTPFNVTTKPKSCLISTHAREEDGFRQEANLFPFTCHHPGSVSVCGWMCWLAVDSRNLLIKSWMNDWVIRRCGCVGGRRLNWHTVELWWLIHFTSINISIYPVTILSTGRYSNIDTCTTQHTTNINN